LVLQLRPGNPLDDERTVFKGIGRGMEGHANLSQNGTIKEKYWPKLKRFVTFRVACIEG
jgi:hypothetical protein